MYFILFYFLKINSSFTTVCSFDQIKGLAWVTTMQTQELNNKSKMKCK